MPIPASLRAELGIEGEAPASGGCIHDCYRVQIGGRSCFLKCNSAQHESAFAAEADGLRALRSADLRAPAPISHGVAGGRAYLLMKFLDLERRGDFAALGRMLAHSHARPGERFGWHRDNYIGATPQANAWCDDWTEFWRKRRMEPQLALAKRNGFDLNIDGVLRVLEGHQARPSLLHGDLWSGNVGFTPEGPVVFDPAVYYGDREADLAMTELFGGFPQQFYEAYRAALPLDPGYEKRKALYNLYHLLNHLNLFGAAYLGQVKAVLRLLLLR